MVATRCLPSDSIPAFRTHDPRATLHQTSLIPSRRRQRPRQLVEFRILPVRDPKLVARPSSFPIHLRIGLP
jgi:hypothetical protein